MTLADAGVRDQQVELARLGDRPLDRAAIPDVDLHPVAGDLIRDRLDLPAATRAHHNIPAVARERPRDARSDAATAARNERPHRTHPTATQPASTDDERRSSAAFYGARRWKRGVNTNWPSLSRLAANSLMRHRVRVYALEYPHLRRFTPASSPASSSSTTRPQGVRDRARADVPDPPAAKRRSCARAGGAWRGGAIGAAVGSRWHARQAGDRRLAER
jgi:hypothetical protein